MKILYIFNTLNYSGAETNYFNAIKYWKNNSKKLDVNILSTGKKVGKFSKNFKKINCKIKKITFEKNINFFFKFYNYLKKKKFDIIHIHPEKAFFIYVLIIRMVYGFKIPIIRTVHHFFNFRNILRLRKIFERQISKRIFNVNFLSNSISGQINENKKFFMKNPVIFNWYDSFKFKCRTYKDYKNSRKKLNINQNTFLILAVGNCVEYKKFELIVDSVNNLYKKKINFIHIGQNNENLKKYIQAKRQNNISKSLKLIPDLNIYYNSADLFIMPSSEEGFGIACVEAMAKGVPVLLSKVKALTDFKKKIKNIEYFNLTQNHLSKKIKFFMSLSKYQRFKLGKQNSLIIKKYFGLEECANKYFELYNKSINNNLC